METDINIRINTLLFFENLQSDEIDTKKNHELCRNNPWQIWEIVRFMQIIISKLWISHWIVYSSWHVKLHDFWTFAGMTCYKIDRRPQKWSHKRSKSWSKQRKNLKIPSRESLECRTLVVLLLFSPIRNGTHRIPIMIFLMVFTCIRW